MDSDRVITWLFYFFGMIAFLLHSLVLLGANVKVFN